MEMAEEVLPWTVRVPLLMTSPTSPPVTEMPERPALVGEANGASLKPSPLVLTLKLSELVIEPLLLMPPTPPVAWMAVEPFTPEMLIEPSLVTLVDAAVVPLLRVTAGEVPETLTEPPLVTSILSGAPPVAVAVAIGAFTLLVIESVANAAPRLATRQRGASATAATRVLRIQESPLSGLETGHMSAHALLQARTHRVQSPRTAGAIRRGACASCCVKVMLQSSVSRARQALATLDPSIPSRCRSS